MVKTYPLGPWPLGIDNVSRETALKADKKGRFIALRDAVNVNIDRDGRAARRGGRALVAALPGCNSYWSSRLGEFASAGTTLYRVTAAGTFDAIGTLNSADRCAYALLNDTVIATNRTTILRIRGDEVQPLGISDASAPTVQAVPTGGLNAGLYGVAVSFLRDGVEGGLSALRMVQVPQCGGIQLSQMPTADDADTVRVYATEPGGELLERVGDTGMGMPSFLIGAGTRGKDAPTQWLRRMPSGQYATNWRGRLLVARNNVMYASRPMAYHLHSPRHGFVQFASRIRMIAGVDSGVYVGTDDGVVFLRGAKPSEWVQESTGGLPPIPGQAIEIIGGDLDPQRQQAGNNLVAWLAPNGFVLGTNDGDLIEPQADRLRLPQRARASLVMLNRRLTAAVQ